MKARILVAGVGNIFLRDDGFGCEVARRLAADALPESVAVMDYGIRGLHLAFELLNPHELLVVVDALARPADPGTLFLLEPDVETLPPGDCSPHGMDLPAVFTQVRLLGGTVPRVRVVGCVPAELEDGFGLSPPVAASVEGAMEMVRELIDRELGSPGQERIQEAGS